MIAIQSGRDALAINSEGAELSRTGFLIRRIVRASVDGRYLATKPDERRVNILDRVSNTVTELPHDRQVNSICWSDDPAKLLTGDETGTLRVWKWRDKEVDHDIQIYERSYVTSITNSSALALVVTASDKGEVTIWTTDPWTRITSLEHPSGVRLCREVGAVRQDRVPEQDDTDR